MADKTINQLNEDTSPTVDDYLATWDVGTGASKKVTLSNIFTLLRGSEWWQELGRATLGSAGDTISVTGLTAKKYLMILIFAEASGGTISCGLRFNSDSGNNYAHRRSDNGGADTTTASTSALSTVPTFGVAGSSMFATMHIINISNKEKLAYFLSNRNDTGAANAPARSEGDGKWVNTASQITRIDAINGGTGDFAIGSEVVVLGHD